MKLRNCNVLLGASGSVAAIRIPRLAKLLLEHGANVKIVTTDTGLNFLENEEQLPERIQVFTDKDEWKSWQQISDPIMHIELRKWADIFLIAPLSANTMAKLANGICDNLLTCIARAWPLGSEKLLFVAPAMNTIMWNHPITAEHVQKLNNFGIQIINPVSKRLACGDVGVGAMSEATAIVDFIEEFVPKDDTTDE